jgi:hypothetical protein
MKRTPVLGVGLTSERGISPSENLRYLPPLPMGILDYHIRGRPRGGGESPQERQTSRSPGSGKNIRKNFWKKFGNRKRKIRSTVPILSEIFPELSGKKRVDPRPQSPLPSELPPLIRQFFGRGVPEKNPEKSCSPTQFSYGKFQKTFPEKILKKCSGTSVTLPR